VTTLQGQALAQPEEIQRWEVALAAVEQANPAGDPKMEKSAKLEELGPISLHLLGIGLCRRRRARRVRAAQGPAALSG
jgi:hypothetical protein